MLKALEEPAANQALEIVTVEIVGAKKAPTIRVYLDAPEGIGFDELSAAQVWINEIVDTLDPFPGAYTLEVSSPGIDRLLRTLEHFKRFTGEKVVITLIMPIESRGKWTGILLGVEEETIVLDLGGDVVRIDYDNIKRAQVKGTVDFSSKNS